MVDIKFPDVGEGITEGTLVKWLVKTGDEIKADQAVAEIETDKAIVEIPTPKAGKISKLFGKEGDVLKVGSTLASLVMAGEEIQVPAAGQPETKPLEIRQAEITPVIKPLEKPPEVQTKVLATPATRRLARELGVDISGVAGSGPGGRVTDEDVKRYTEAPPKPAEVMQPEVAPETKALEERIQIKGIRKTIGERMVKSLFTAPHVVSMDEADVTELVKLREKEKKTAEEKGIKLTYLAFIIKAVTVALKQHPYLNASLDPQKNEIVLKRYYNIGVAVDTPKA